MAWQIVYILAVVMLLIHWNGPNAVWGTATLGFLIGVIVALFCDGFDWWLVANCVAIAILVGAVFELVPRLISMIDK